MKTVEQLWAPCGKPIVTAKDYFKSLHGRKLNVLYLGAHVDEPVDHPALRPSVNAVAETYRLRPNGRSWAAPARRPASW